METDVWVINHLPIFTPGWSGMSGRTIRAQRICPSPPCCLTSHLPHLPASPPCLASHLPAPLPLGSLQAHPLSSQRHSPHIGHSPRIPLLLPFLASLTHPSSIGFPADDPLSSQKHSRTFDIPHAFPTHSLQTHPLSVELEVYKSETTTTTTTTSTPAAPLLGLSSTKPAVLISLRFEYLTALRLVTACR